jgi:hypothetical protein
MEPINHELLWRAAGREAAYLAKVASEKPVPLPDPDAYALGLPLPVTHTLAQVGRKMTREQTELLAPYGLCDVSGGGLTNFGKSVLATFK